MPELSIGVPIPVGIIETQENGLLALPDPAKTAVEMSDHATAADVFILVPMKLGLATVLASWAFALNPFFAMSGYKVPETGVV